MVYKIKPATIFFSAALCILCSAFSLSENDVLVVEERKCLGTICINKTSPEEIMRRYGTKKADHYKKRYEKPKGYGTRRWTVLEYAGLGLKFVSTTENSPVYEIEISAPFSAQTAKGIQIGKSEARDIIAVYGQPEERLASLKTAIAKSDTDTACCDSTYRHPSLGIDFSIDCDTSKKDEKRMSYKLKKIRIYEARPSM